MQKRLRLLRVGALVALLLLSLSLFYFSQSNTATAAAGINHQINFQGKLVNPDGTNVTDGSYSVVFSLYSQQAPGGSAIWTETQSVGVSNGIFQVNLGSVTTLPGSIDFNTDNIFLGVKVGADAEMTPRIQFTSVPQAFNSEKLNGLASSAFAQLAANQTFTGTNTFQPTTNISSVKILQNSSGSFGQDVFAVQGSSGGTNNFIQVTSTAANQGAVTIQALGANTLTLGANAGAGTISVNAANVTGTGALNVSAGGTNQAIDLEASGTGIVNLGVSSNNKTVNIGATSGNPANTTTVNIATSTGAAQTVNIGDTNGASAVNIKAGSGNITLNSTNIVTQNSFTTNLTRTVPTTVGTEVDLGSFALTNGGGNFTANIAIPSTGFSVAKNYSFAINFNQTTNTWVFVQPTSDSGPYSGNDVTLEANVNSGTLSLRLRRSAGTTAGTAYITLEHDGVAADAFTPSTSTAAVAAPTAYLSSSIFTQAGGAASIQGNTTFNGSGTFNLGASNQLSVTSGSNVPTTDQVAISNAGSSGVTTAGVNGLSINYKGGAAAVESAGERIDLQPGTTSGGTWSALRVVAGTTGAVAGVTENGIKLQGPTSLGAGTENAITIDANWDNAIAANGFTVSGTGAVTAASVNLTGLAASSFVVTDASKNLTTSASAATSSELTSILSDETGSGAAVFGTSPTITTSLVAGSTTFSLLTAATTLDFGSASGTTTSNGNLTVASGKTFTVTGNTVFNTGTANSVSITSGSSVPTADQIAITNAGSTGVVTAGVNGLSINYKGGAAAIESAGERIDIQPGTTSGGTWSGLRVVPNATGAVAGVTEYGLKLDALTTPGAGTESAIYVGAGWDNILQSANFSIAQSGAVTNNSTYNTNTFNSNTLTFGNNASASALSSGTSQALNITANAASTWSTSAGNLTIQAAGTSTLSLDTAGAGTINLGTNAATITLGSGASAETVNLGNSTAVDTVNIATNTGNDIVNVLTNTGTNTLTVGNTSGSTTSAFYGNATFNLQAGKQVSVTAGTTVPTADQVAITNAGTTGVTTAGVNGLSVSYKGGSAAIEAAAERIDLQPGTLTGGTWSALRIVPNATGAVAGVTEYGLKLDALTTPGAGTESAIFVGSGWDNVIQSANFNVTQAGAITSVGVNSGSGQIAGTGGLNVTGIVNFGSLTASSVVFTDASKNLTSSAASSALATGLTDETGTGFVVFGTSPSITTSLLTGSASFDLLNTNATTINFGGAATTAINIGPGSTTATSINLAGGSAATGCTIDGATGNLNCTGTITSGSGTVGYFSRVSTTLQPTTAGDNIQTTSGGTITSDGVLTANGGLTVNSGANLGVSVTSGSTVPTADQVAISNTGSTGVTTAGVNGLSINYKGGAAAVESAGERIDLQPGTLSGGAWSALRIVPNATGAVSGVTEYGLKLDALTTPGAGTESAIYVGSGWDNVLQSTNFTVTQAGAITSVGVNSGSGQISGSGGLSVTGTVNFGSLGASSFVVTDASKNLSTTAGAATSSELSGILSDETGSGVAVFATSPTITTSLLTGSTSFDLLNTNATTINFGGAATTALNIGAAGGTTTITGALTVANNKNFNIGSTSGTGVFTQSYSNTVAGNAQSITIANTNAGAGVTIQGTNFTPTNTSTASSGTNVLNVINFAAGGALGGTDQTNGLNFASATGYTNFIKTPTAVLSSGGALTGLTGLTVASGNLNVAGLTASQVVFTDVSKNLVSTGASAALSAGLTDETGSGVAVFGTSPTITTSLLAGSSTFSLLTAATTLDFGSTSGTTTSNGNLTVASGKALSVTGNATINTGTGSTLSVTSGSSVPTTDQLAITNTGSTGVTTAGVNGLSIAYKGGAAAIESAASRVDLTPGTTSGGTWSGYRFVPNATGPVAGVVINGIKLDTITTPGAGTENGIYIGSGYDNILNFGGTPLINGSGVLQSAALAGTYSGAIALSNASNSFTGSGAGLTSLNGSNVSSGVVGVGVGGTGISTYAVGDLLYASGSTTLSKLADVTAGSCLTSGGVGIAPSWGTCGTTTLQSAYTADVDGGDVTIALSSTDGSLIVQNPVSGGSTSGYTMKIANLATGAVEGLRIESAGTGNLFTVRDTTATAADVFTIADGGAATFKSQTNSPTAFQIQNSSSVALLTGDTSNMKLNVIGTVGITGSNTAATPTVIGSTNNATPAFSSSYAVNTHASSQTGDLVIISIYMEPANEGTGSATYGTIVPAAGATLVPGFPINTDDSRITTGNTLRLYEYYYYATANGAQTLTFTDSSSPYWGITATTIRGGPTSGNPLADTAVTNVSLRDATNITSTPPVSQTYAAGNTLSMFVYGNWGGGGTGSGNPAPIGYSTSGGYPTTNPTQPFTATSSNSGVSSGPVGYSLTNNYSGMATALLSFRAPTPANNLQVLNANGGTQVGLVNATGGTLFRNSTNSAGAFAVQNTAGTNIFGVDTLNGSVKVTANSTTAFQVQNTGGAPLLVADTTNMFVGIGVSAQSPTEKVQLQVEDVDTSTISSTTKNVLFETYPAPASSIGSTFKIYQALEARTYTSNNNLGSGTELYGIDGKAWYEGTATIGLLQGLSGGAILGNSASVAANAVGIDGYVNNGSTGTISSAYGVVAELSVNGGGTIATGYNLFAQSPSVTAGTLTTAYGLYVKPMKVTGVGTGYGLYQEGASDLNVINGITTFTGSGNGSSQYGVLLKNATNSTTAFGIQNAAGASLFQVGTSINNITIGGNNSSELTSWSTSANALPATRTSFGTVVANGYVYAIAGRNTGAASNLTSYAKLNADGTTGAWANTTNAATSGGAAVVYANGYIYTLGGGANGTTAVYSTKPNSDGTITSWITDNNVLPQAVTGATAVYNNGYIYVIGGTNSTLYLSTVYYAKVNPDGTTGAWQTSTNPLPAVRTTTGTVVANGYVYVMGGRSGPGNSSTNTVYYAKLNANGSTSTWTTSGNTLPAVRSQGGAVTANGYMYFIGGVDGAGTGNNTVYASKLNSDGTHNTWTTNTNALPAALFGNASVVYNGYVYAIGGTVGATEQTAVYYASTQRVRIGGALDLVGLSGGTAGDNQNGVGGELTAGNTNVIGSLQVQGQVTFAQNLGVNGVVTIGSGSANGTVANSTAALYVGTNGTRSINASGTINASGADYAEYIPWSGTKPAAGSIVSYAGSNYIVSSQATAGFVGNAGLDEEHSLLVTFTGQVPVQVTGTVNVGDILLSNGDGTARAVSSADATVGELLAKVAIAQESSSDVGVKLIMASVGTSSDSAGSALQNQSANFANVNVAGATNLNDLNVTGTANFADINSSGLATLDSLNVIGSQFVGGDLTVHGSVSIDHDLLVGGDLTVQGIAHLQDIEVAGHIITASGQPASQVMTAAGQSAAVAVSGTDTTGTITITTGSAAISAGDLAKLTFSKAYTGAPRIVLSGDDDASIGSRVYAAGKTMTDFTLQTAQTLAPNTTYTFDYFIAQ